VKLLFLAPRFHTNQVPLVRVLKARGHTVAFDVLSTGGSEDHGLLTPTVVEPSYLSSALLRFHTPTNVVKYRANWTFPSPVRYLRRLRSIDPDVVIVRDPELPFSLVAGFAARISGYPVVLYTQGPVHAPRRLRSDVARSAALAIMHAPLYSPVRGDASRPRVHEHAHYLPFVADLDRTPKTQWFRGDRVNLLTIGKFVARKNIVMLLDAFGELRRRRDDVTLTIAGEVSTSEHRAHLQEVEGRIAHLGLRDVVDVQVNVPFDLTPDLYARHDLFVLPSRKEPASVSILEAMAHGLPAVCSTTNGTQWYIDDGRSGHVFASDDRADLSEKLDAAVADRERLRRMGAHARHLAETVHHPDAVYESFMRIVGSRRRERRQVPKGVAP